MTTAGMFSKSHSSRFEACLRKSESQFKVPIQKRGFRHSSRNSYMSMTGSNGKSVSEPKTNGLVFNNSRKFFTYPMAQTFWNSHFFLQNKYKKGVVVDHSVFDCDDPELRKEDILIILNRPIESKTFFQTLLKKTCTIICTDGGANRLCKEFDSVVPNYIVGDLDSVK